MKRKRNEKLNYSMRLEPSAIKSLERQIDRTFKKKPEEKERKSPLWSNMEPEEDNDDYVVTEIPPPEMEPKREFKLPKITSPALVFDGNPSSRMNNALLIASDDGSKMVSMREKMFSDPSYQDLIKFTDQSKKPNYFMQSNQYKYNRLK